MTSCPSCGTPNTEGARFCVKCGTTLSSAPAPESWRAPSGDLNETVVDQTGPSTGGYAPPQPPPSAYPTYTPPHGMQQQYGVGGDWQAMGANKKLPAGICGIVLGGFGVHKFILGYNVEGIIMLAAWIVGMFLTCGIGSLVVGVIGLVEGIIYLTKSDEEFVRTYIQGRKGWF